MSFTESRRSFGVGPCSTSLKVHQRRFGLYSKGLQSISLLVHDVALIYIAGQTVGLLQPSANGTDRSGSNNHYSHKHGAQFLWGMRGRPMRISHCRRILYVPLFSVYVRNNHQSKNSQSKSRPNAAYTP